MTVVPFPHADIAVDADFFCELVHWENGRCARDVKSEDHHVETRAQGGSNDASNRCLACPTHHRAIHFQSGRKTGDEEKDFGSVGWMFRVVLPDGNYAYAEETEPRDRDLSKDILRNSSAEFEAILDELDLAEGYVEWELILGPFLRERGFELWLIWSNVSSGWLEAASSAHEKIRHAVELESDVYWFQAEGFYELFVGQKWTLLGLDISHDPRDPFAALSQYSVHAGVTYRVAKDRLRTERRRRRLPPVEADRARGLPYRLMRDGGKRILRLSAEDRDRVFTEAEVGTASSALDELGNILKEADEEIETRVVVGEIRIRIYAEVDVEKATGKTDDEQRPVDHVRKRFQVHRYVEEIIDVDVREVEGKVASGGDQHQELGSVPAPQDRHEGHQATVD